MDCNETRRLLAAHLDEELDVVNDAAVAAHLETCPACAESALAHTEQHRLLQEKLTRHRAPPEFAAQIRAALPRTEPVAGSRELLAWVRPLAMAASLGGAALVGSWWGLRTSRADLLVGEMTATHARVRLTGHVIDVESSDRHTVKPWFAGRVDFAPLVPDLAADGFPLTGGRLDRIGGRTVATLVYARRKHSIDVHMWTGAPEPVAGAVMRDGYAVLGWKSNGLNYTAVTDAAQEELAAFARLMQAAK